MDDRPRPDEQRTVTLRLELYVDRQPISGRLSTARGAEEPFVGWLGFFDALSKLDALPELPDLPGLSRAHDDAREEPAR